MEMHKMHIPRPRSVRRFVDALSEALIDAGFTGEVDVRFADDERSLTWIGKPNDRDMICAVTITRMQEPEEAKR